MGVPGNNEIWILLKVLLNSLSGFNTPNTVTVCHNGSNKSVAISTLDKIFCRKTRVGINHLGQVHYLLP